MTIKKQVNLLTEFFEQEHLDYAVIDAFALYAYGYTRATRDIDFIARLTDQARIVEFLESLGFETLNRSNGYSNHLHPVEAVRIDLVYVEGETAEKIFRSIQRRVLFENQEIPVVSPEHLVALKLFAIRNDPDRKYKELADIKENFRITGVDRDQVWEYFRQYGLEEYYGEFAGKK
jgi:hypothetical protein